MQALAATLATFLIPTDVPCSEQLVSKGYGEPKADDGEPANDYEASPVEYVKQRRFFLVA